MKTKNFILLILPFISVAGCKKDANNETSITLTSKTWMRAMEDKNPSTNPSGKVEYYAIQDFEKDDTFEFGTDGKLMINRGKLKSNANQLQNEVQNYDFDRAKSLLTIEGQKYSVAEESKTQLKFYAPISNNTGFQYLVFVFN